MTQESQRLQFTRLAPGICKPVESTVAPPLAKSAAGTAKPVDSSMGVEDSDRLAIVGPSFSPFLAKKGKDTFGVSGCYRCCGKVSAFRFHEAMVDGQRICASRDRPLGTSASRHSGPGVQIQRSRITKRKNERSRLCSIG